MICYVVIVTIAYNCFFFACHIGPGLMPCISFNTEFDSWSHQPKMAPSDESASPCYCLFHMYVHSGIELRQFSGLVEGQKRVGQQGTPKITMAYHGYPWLIVMFPIEAAIWGRVKKPGGRALPLPTRTSSYSHSLHGPSSKRGQHLGHRENCLWDMDFVLGGELPTDPK